MVNPHDYTPEDLKTCNWFWKKDRKGSDTYVDEIQNGHSPTEDEAWSDLIRQKRGAKPVKEAEGMSLEDAQRIVGRTNAVEPYLSNMIRALSSMPALNSAEENERLAAAKMVRAAKRKGK